MRALWLLTGTTMGMMLVNAPLRADYRSLTPSERALVDKAFQQAEFYKYYESLAQGADSIEVKAVKLTNTNQIDEETQDNTYEVELAVRVADQVFRRDMKLVLRLKVKPEGWSLSRWVWTLGGWVVAVVVIVVVVL